MDVVPREELETLIRTTGKPCVSMFMPTHRAGIEVKQDPIRLKNLLRHAEERLLADGMRAPAARTMLEPAQQLVGDDLFWQHQADGLALFLAPDWFRRYSVPVSLEELCVVAGRFHVKPLLKLFAGDGRFFLLALSQNEIRLFEGSHFSVAPVPTNGMPASLADALKYDDPERQLQLHVGTTTGSGGIFHGQGTGTDDAKDAIRRYFQQVDRGLHGVLRDRREPLLIAGVDYLLPIYREVNSYPHLLPDVLTGNPESFSPQQLHDRAWAVVGPHFQTVQQETLTQFRELAGAGRASSDVIEVVRAAAEGRVDRLIVVEDAHCWGRYDPATHETRPRGTETPENGDQDLLDLAACQTILTGGTVFAAASDQLGDVGSIAAVFRY